MNTAAERAEEIVVLWKERKDRGEALAPDDLVAQHPDLKAEIRLRLAALALLDRALGEAVRAREALPDFPDFRIVRELGRGGAGVVYEAEQRSMRRVVALKVLYPAITLNPKSVERFRREAQAAGRLHHTNIVPVYGIGEEGGTWFYVMERIRGRTLADVIADQRRIGGPSPAGSQPDSTSTPFATGRTGQAYYARVALAFAGLAEALEHAHAEGVLHRDLKPSNVLLDEDGTLKITDFGLARVEGEVAPLTMTGDLVGTPVYMSPEQVRRGSAPLDGRADLYSLGATLYEFLTLRPPFAGASLQDVFAQILSKDPPPPRRENRRIPRDLETIVVKAMEKDSERRYRTAGDLARDLRAFAEVRAIAARRVRPLGRAWRAVRRSPVRSGLIATVLLLAATAATLAVESRADRARRAEAEYSELLARSEQLQRRSSFLTINLVETGAADDGVVRSREILKAAVALEPSRPEAYVELALLEGDPDERLAQLDRARERGLVERAYRLARASIEYQAGRDEATREDATLARSLPDGGGWREASLEGRMLRREGRWKEAIHCLTLAIDRERAAGIFEPATLELRAEAREEGGDIAGALEDLATVHDETTSSSPYVDVRIASLWRRLGHEELGESGFARALASASKDGSAGAWVGLCSACASEQEFEWLERAAEPALAAHSREANLMRLRAWGLQRSCPVPWPATGVPASAAFTRKRAAALRWIEESLRLEPNSIKSRWLRGAILADMGLPKEALAEAHLARALAPTDARAAMLEATLLFAAGSREVAIVILRECSRVHPYSHEVLNRLGNALRDAGRPAEAMPVLEQALRLHSRCLECRDLYAQVLRDTGRLDSALREIDDSIAIWPRNGHMHGTRGGILDRLGRQEDALAAWERAAALVPDEDAYGTNHALMLLKLGRGADALAEATAGVKRRPAAVGWKRTLAEVYAASGHHALAIATLDEALKLAPNDSGLHIIRGNVFLSLGKSRDVVLEWQQAATLDPVNGDIRNSIARQLLTLHEYEQALMWAREAVAIDDRNGLWWNTLAAALLNTGRDEEALSALEKASALLPDAEEPAQNRVVALLHLHRPKDALAEATAAAAKHPASAPCQFMLGKAYEASGRPTEALASLDKAIDLDPKDADLHIGRGDVLLSLGRVRDAIVDWQRAADLDPANASVRHALASALLSPSETSAGNAERAGALMREATAIDGQKGDYWDTLGLALFRSGHLEDALAAFSKAIALMPDAEIPAVNRVFALIGLHRAADALDAATIGAAQHPVSSRWQVLVGRACDESRLPTKAMAAYTRAIGLDPTSAEPWIARGCDLVAAGKLTEAFGDLQRGASLDPRDAIVRNNLAYVLLNTKDATLQDLSRALAWSREAVALDDGNSVCWRTLAGALHATGRHDEELAALEKAAALSQDSDRREAIAESRIPVLLELHRAADALAEATAGAARHPDSARWHDLLGRAYMASGQPTQAMAALDRAIELDATQSRSFCDRGDLFLSLERLPEATRDWQRAAALDPTNPNVRNSAAWVLATATDAKLRDPVRAVELAREAIAIDGRSGDAWNTLGVALCRDGQWKKAIEALEESAKRSDGGTAFDWFFAAIAHKRLGEDVQAKECFARATTWESAHGPDLAPGSREELTRFRREAEEALGIADSKAIAPRTTK